jgi:hypothetical protein
MVVVHPRTRGREVAEEPEAFFAELATGHDFSNGRGTVIYSFFPYFANEWARKNQSISIEMCENELERVDEAEDATFGVLSGHLIPLLQSSIVARYQCIDIMILSL